MPLCVAVVAGCGKDDEKKVASQVAVKVNSDEITVHQVNNVLARLQEMRAQVPANARGEAVERLIERELARQQAIQRRLDRSPQVVQAIEAARAEILARAYLQQVAAGKAKPTAGEVKKYYAEHSELFAERRLYVLEEMTFEPREDIAAELRGRVGKAGSLQEVGDWLKAKQVEYTVQRIGRPAEDIPLEMLPALKTMKDGDIQVVEYAGRVSVLRVAASRPAPVDEATATPRIEQFLANQRSGQSITEELKRLRAQARIEYLGEFAASAAQVPAKENQTLTSLERAVRALR